VFLAPSIPAIASDLAPGVKERAVAAFSSTLIWERDARLVDTPITSSSSRLANWVWRAERIYDDLCTHGHGDHFFGTSTVRSDFQVPALSRGRR